MANMNGDFLYIIGQHDPEKPLLPIVHMTSITNLASIVQNRQIDLTPCTVLKKDLIYSFYGKPTYQVKGNTPSPSKKLADAAVCIALDLPEIRGYIDQIHAFDTGGFHGQRYDEYLPKGTDLTDFELPRDMLSAARYVRAFFGSNTDYYNGNLKKNLNIKPFDIVSEAILNLANSSVSSNFDARVASVEITINHSIKLTKRNVVGIVCPDRTNDDSRFRDACREWSVNPVFYRFKRATAEGRTDVIYEKLGDYYVIKKWMS